MSEHIFGAARSALKEANIIRSNPPSVAAISLRKSACGTSLTVLPHNRFCQLPSRRRYTNNQSTPPEPVLANLLHSRIRKGGICPKARTVRRAAQPALWQLVGERRLSDMGLAGSYMVLARHWSRVGRQAFRACDCRQLFRNDLIVQTLVVIAESDYPIYPFVNQRTCIPLISAHACQPSLLKIELWPVRSAGTGSG